MTYDLRLVTCALHDTRLMTDGIVLSCSTFRDLDPAVALTFVVQVAIRHQSSVVEAIRHNIYQSSVVGHMVCQVVSRKA